MHGGNNRIVRARGVAKVRALPLSPRTSSRQRQAASLSSLLTLLPANRVNVALKPSNPVNPAAKRLCGTFLMNAVYVVQ
jgi:hypothetical protein